MKDQLSDDRSAIDEVIKLLGNERVIIGGGCALIIYRLYLSREGPPPVATRDIDTLIRRNASKANLHELLVAAGFKWEPKSAEPVPAECYRKRIGNKDVELEFITNYVSHQDHGNVKLNGIVAQQLRYLEMSLANFIEFRTDSGATGLVVSPGAWCFHKILSFRHRKHGNLKKYKDLYGAWYVLHELGQFSEGARSELVQLMKANSSWATAAKKNVREWIAEATPKDEKMLSQQDPSGTCSLDAIKKTFDPLFSA